MKRFLIYNRIVLLVTAAIIQLVVMVEVILRFNQYFEVFYGVNIFIGALAFIWVLNNKSNPAYKIAWIVPILLFPIFGALFYFFGSNKPAGRKANVADPAAPRSTGGHRLSELIGEMLMRESSRGPSSSTLTIHRTAIPRPVPAQRRSQVCPVDGGTAEGKALHLFGVLHH